MRDAENAPEAEACFRTAIEVARRRAETLLKLRATTSLARLIRATPIAATKGARCSPIYNWFTEGFDTRDLKDAKALLEELGG